MEEILGTNIRSANDREFRRRCLVEAHAKLADVIAAFDGCADDGSVTTDIMGGLVVNLWVDVSHALNYCRYAKRGQVDDGEGTA
jgi:hypothetical protein